MPVDKKDAHVLVTVNSKEPFGEPDDMKFRWRIFYCVKEERTVPSLNWEGAHWGLFSGDDDAMKAHELRDAQHERDGIVFDEEGEGHLSFLRPVESNEP